eukprot:Skav228058  [mRNA]  locus=scaffold2067:65158:73316:- [translate_table: standard]
MVLAEFQEEPTPRPYKDSLDYLNDQFSLLECEIRIAEHRRQSTKEDVGVEELGRKKPTIDCAYVRIRKLALARIHHRLKLTKEAGLEVPRLEVLLQKTKLPGSRGGQELLVILSTDALGRCCLLNRCGR